MIWLRRFLALFFALLFIPLFIVMLLVARVNSTLGNPDFYIEQLRKADIYNFIYDELLPVALEEVKPSPESPPDITKLKAEAVPFVKQILPPDWLQTQVEQVINKVLPYILGDTDSFTVTVPLKDRVEAARKAVKETLHKENIFSSIYDQALAQVLDRVAKGDAQIPMNLSRAELDSAVRSVLPPDWLLSQIDNAIDQVVPYLVKDSEHFVIRLDISQRLDALERVAADILRRPATYESILKKFVTEAVGEGVQLGQLPAGITVTNEEFVQIIKEALPLEWYQSLVNDIVSQVFSYLRGTQETLEVVLPLADRKSTIAASLTDRAGRKLESYINALPTCTRTQLEQMLFTTDSKDLPTCRPPGFSYLRQGERGEIFLIRIDLSQETETLTAILTNMIQRRENYDRFLDRVLGAIAAKGVVQLPIGLTLTADEVMPAVRDAFSLTWYQSLSTDIARQVTLYLTGSRETLEVTVPVVEPKQALTASLTELADRKLETYVESLPLCSPQELAEMLTNPPRGRLPTCRPPGYSYSQLKDLLDIDIRAQVTSLLDTAIPDQWLFTQAELNQMFGGQNQLAQAMEVVKKGMTFSVDLSTYIVPAVATIPDRWTLTEAELGKMLPADFLVRAQQYATQGLTFTEADLSRVLGKVRETQLQDIRNQISGGITFTQDELRERLGPEGQRSLDEFRNVMGQARRWLFLGWIFPALLLGAIGMLGGRRWWSKLAWAAIVLGIAAAIVYILSGPVYSWAIRPQMEAALSQLVMQAEGVELVLGEKAIALVHNGIDTFISGLRHQSVWFLLLALAGLGGAIFWKRRRPSP